MDKILVEKKALDKTDWPEGPWKEEPDLKGWLDGATSLPCFIRRSEFEGYFCGYIGIPKNHPLHSISYNEINKLINFKCKLNFSSLFGDKFYENPHSSCLSNDLWWVGFSCDSYKDFSPLKYTFSEPDISAYKDVKFLEKQCAEIAAKLVKYQIKGTKKFIYEESSN